MDKNLQRLEEVFRDVFENPELKITRQTSAKDIEDWDSLMHINLLAAVQSEFDIRLNVDDVSGLKNVGDMLDVIERKLR